MCDLSPRRERFESCGYSTTTTQHDAAYPNVQTRPGNTSLTQACSDLTIVTILTQSHLSCPAAARAMHSATDITCRRRTTPKQAESAHKIIQGYMSYGKMQYGSATPDLRILDKHRRQRYSLKFCSTCMVEAQNLQEKEKHTLSPAIVVARQTKQSRTVQQTQGLSSQAVPRWP